MKTISEIQDIFQKETGVRPTVSKRYGSMKEYIHFKVSMYKFWDDWKNPALKRVCNQIGDNGDGTFNDNTSIDVHKSLISDVE